MVLCGTLLISVSAVQFQEEIKIFFGKVFFYSKILVATNKKYLKKNFIRDALTLSTNADSSIITWK